MFWSTLPFSLISLHHSVVSQYVVVEIALSALVGLHVFDCALFISTDEHPLCLSARLM